MFEPGEIIAYYEMCLEEGTSLQRGMNFRLPSGHSVLLMSHRRGAPYNDRVEEDGRVLVYEGHDAVRDRDGPDPKTIDQPEYTSTGTPTQNRLFREAASSYRAGTASAEPVRVYEKLRPGIWVFNGSFRLLDSWPEPGAGRQVFKFRLELASETPTSRKTARDDITHTRLIPTAIKLDMFRRDRGECTECGATDNLHFDHILPFSRGGTSLRAENIQLLCARHNLEKHDRIE